MLREFSESVLGPCLSKLSLWPFDTLGMSPHSIQQIDSAYLPIQSRFCLNKISAKYRFLNIPLEPKTRQMSTDVNRYRYLFEKIISSRPNVGSLQNTSIFYCHQVGTPGITGKI